MTHKPSLRGSKPPDGTRAHNLTLQGDWRGISRQFVTTRTPTQVASHAQKYYIRQTNQNRRKRRASLFDLANPEHAQVSLGARLGRLACQALGAETANLLQARSSPRASQATTALSDGEQLQSKAESSWATMPEASQSCAPSHSAPFLLFLPDAWC